VDLQSFDDSD